MNNTATSFVQIKVGKKEYMERLFHQGEIYLNSTLYFMEHTDPRIGDIFEGTEIVENGKILKYRNELDKEKLFCMWHIDSKNPINDKYVHNLINNPDGTTDVELDLRSMQSMHGDDSTIILIYNVQEFNKRFENACKKANVDFIEKRIVHYYDEYSKTRVNKITPFMKRSGYNDQQEVRYLVKTNSSRPLVLYLGDLSDISKMIDSNIYKIVVNGTLAKQQDEKQCTCDCPDCSEQSQELPPVAPIINDDYIEQFNDWD